LHTAQDEGLATCVLVAPDSRNGPAAALVNHGDFCEKLSAANYLQKSRKIVIMTSLDERRS
jgi:hypothetical protein